MSALITLILWWSIWLALFRRAWSVKLVAAVTILGLLLLYSGVGTLADYYRAWYPHYTIARYEKVRLGPDTTYGICGEVQIDDQVEVIRKNTNWSCIVSPAIKGWVLSDCLCTNIS